MDPMGRLRLMALVLACGVAAVAAESTLGNKCSTDTQRYDCGVELVCRDRTCQGCITDDDCDQFSWNRVCKESSFGEPGRRSCVHKDLFPNFNWYDAGSSLLVFLGAALAASGGVGGGGIFVPIMVLVNDFAARFAAPLSDVMITCGAIVNFVLFFPKTLDDGKTPLIDFDVALVFEPMILCGTIVGVIFNGSFPEWLIVVCFIVVLSSATWRTAKKGWAVWKAESAAGRKRTNQTLEAKYSATTMSRKGVPVGIDASDESMRGENSDFGNVTWVNVDEEQRRRLSSGPKEERRQSTGAGEETPTLADIKPAEEFTRRSSVTNRPSYVGSEQYEMSLLDNDQLQPSTPAADTATSDAHPSTGEYVVAQDQRLSFMETLVPSKRQFTNMVRGVFCLPYIHENKAECSTHARMVPWDKLLMVLMIWFSFLMLNLFRGGKGASAFGIEKCSPSFWVATAISIPAATVVTLVIALKIARDNKRSEDLGIATVEGHIQWAKHGNIVRYPVICFMSGIMAGLLGIGGGMIIGPLLLEIGVHPQRAAATTSFTVLFTSTATVVQRVMAKTLKYDYGLWMGMCAFLGSLIGQLYVSYIVRKYHKTALIIFCLGSGIGISAVILGITGVTGIVESIRHGAYMGMRNYCQT